MRTRAKAFAVLLLWAAGCLIGVLSNSISTPHEVFAFWDAFQMDKQLNGALRQLCKDFPEPHTFNNFVNYLKSKDPRAPSVFGGLTTDPNVDTRAAADEWRSKGYSLNWRKDTGFINSPAMDWDGVRGPEAGMPQTMKYLGDRTQELRRQDTRGQFEPRPESGDYDQGRAVGRIRDNMRQIHGIRMATTNGFLLSDLRKLTTPDMVKWAPHWKSKMASTVPSLKVYYGADYEVIDGPETVKSATAADPSLALARNQAGYRRGLDLSKKKMGEPQKPGGAARQKDVHWAVLEELSDGRQKVEGPKPC